MNKKQILKRLRYISASITSLAFVSSSYPPEERVRVLQQHGQELVVLLTQIDLLWFEKAPRVRKSKGTPSST
jgi:flagellar biosynthesis/type III secretory pathway chaperone